MHSTDSQSHAAAPILAAMLAFKEGARMARRRYQQGQLIEEHHRWSARWREDVILPKGTPLRKTDKLLPGGEVQRRIQKRRVIATKRSCPTKRLAMRKLEEVLRDINREDYSPHKTDTVERFAERWKATVMIHHKPATQSNETSILKKHLIPVFGKMQFRDITGEMLQAYVSNHSLKPKSVKGIIATFHLLWAKAKSWGYVRHDPFEGLTMPADDAEDIYYFSIDEALAIINEASGWERTFLHILAETSMRPGECAGLRREDLQGRILTIKQSVWGRTIQLPKTPNAIRTLPISETLAEEVENLSTAPNTWNLLFLDAAQPVYTDAFRKRVFDPILNKLGIRQKAGKRRVGLYSFRHMGATEMSRRGVPLKTIQKRVGHALGSQITMERYIHAIDADSLAAADLLGGLLSPQREENPRSSVSDTASSLEFERVGEHRL